MQPMQQLAKRIKRYSRSLKVTVKADAVTVQPAFQHPFEVNTWEQFQQACEAGRCELPDDEMCGYGEGS